MSHSRVQEPFAFLPPLASLPPLAVVYFDDATGEVVAHSTLDDPREVFCRCYNALATGRTAYPASRAMRLASSSRRAV